MVVVFVLPQHSNQINLNSKIQIWNSYATLRTTVGAAEAALSADFRVYEHDRIGSGIYLCFVSFFCKIQTDTRFGVVVVRTLAYSLPDEIASHVAFVGGYLFFEKQKKAYLIAGCSGLNNNILIFVALFAFRRHATLLCVKSVTSTPSKSKLVTF